MSEEKFENPRVAINRVYTRTGDKGETGLAGGPRVPKDSPRVAAYGDVDELNAAVGAARAGIVASGDARLAPLAEILLRVQHELFNFGSILATRPAFVHPKQARVTPAEVAQLEAEMDRCNADLEPLRSFVLPGGSRVEADLHVCRTVCRRAERSVVTLARAEGAAPPDSIEYLNRLSDAMFVFSRWANHAVSAPETLWEPNRASSGRNS